MAGWKSVEEIDAYRLAVELRDDIGRFTDSGPVTRDFKFRDQIRDASSSTTRNLSEGFDRYFHGEFAYFAGIAKGSLGETIDLLKDAKEKKYLFPEEFDRLLRLAVRAKKATGGLLSYLRSSEAPGESARRRKRKRRKKPPGPRT